MSQPSNCLQLLPGRKIREMTDDNTAPREKKTESKVRRYCFECGRFSRNSVPSVGIEPLSQVSSDLLENIMTHPTALPSKNIQTRRTGKVGAKLAPIPKTAVKKRVTLNGRARPSRSETVPQPTAPIIIWAVLA
jgi:hypothetical protein